MSKDQKVEWVLNGTWDNKMEGSKVRWDDYERTGVFI
jgi:hypothetical protein